MTDREPQTLMSHRQFAKHVGRSRRAISNWIEDGHISPSALVDGKIWIEKALPELLLSLDERKQNTLSDPPPIDAAWSSDPTAADLLKRRRLADTKRAEELAIAAARANNIQSGKWMETEAAQKEWGKQLAEELQAIEYWELDTAAKEIAGEFGLDWRLVSAKLRKLWYQFRQERSAKHKKAAE